MKNWQRVQEKVVQFIKNSLEDYHKDKILIGLSGGLDSAVCAKLAVEAVGQENVIAIHLKERDTPNESTYGAKIMAEHLNLPLLIKNTTFPILVLGIYCTQPLIGFLVPEKIKAAYAKTYYQVLSKNNHFYYKRLINKLGKNFNKNRVYFEDKSRIITLYFYHYASLNNALVIDTANKTELSIGYYVVYGQAGDIMPISDLYKTEVREFAKFLGIPEYLINKPPAPDIIPGLTDEYIIGLSYKELDQILLLLEENKDISTIQAQTGVSEEKIQDVMKIKEVASKIQQIPRGLDLKELEIA